MKDKLEEIEVKIENQLIKEKGEDVRDIWNNKATKRKPTRNN